MKYLVNRTTKEHRIAGKDWQDTDTDYWRVVQADSEGWLPHTGNVCPLPEDSRCEVRCVGCNPTDIIPAGGWLWNIPMTGTYRITHYRPILEAEKVEDHLSAAEWNKRVRDSTDKLLAEAGYQPDCSIRHGLAMLRLEAEPVQEPEPIPAPQYDPRSVSFNLLDRLKAAHAQAQTIPDLEAELREVLGSMGYDLVARSPFVNQCCGNPAQCWEPCGDLGKSEAHVAVSPEPDMTDWRNWREGDLILDINSPLRQMLPIVTMEPPSYTGKAPVALKGMGDVPYWPDIYQLRFHSRPAKGE